MTPDAEESLSMAPHGDFRVVASDDARSFISDAGGLLFVWPVVSRSFRLALTVLEASCTPPARALEFRRLDVGGFLLFLHPGIRRLPQELDVEVRGRRHRRIAVYWDGLAYVA